MDSPETRWDTPELGVRAFRVMLLYFERSYGRARLEQVWADAALPLPLAFVEDLENFVSVAFVERLLGALVKGSGDENYLDRAGRQMATPEALGFAYYLLRAMGSPQFLYQKAFEHSAAYNRVGTFTVEKSARTELTFAYRSTTRERDRNLCITRMANFAAFPSIWNLPDATVEELACLARGDDCCRYHLSWRPQPPVAWRRWLGLPAGVAVGAGLAAVTGGPLALSAAFGLAGLAGLVTGAWLDLRVISRRKDAEFAEQNRGLSRFVAELQRRADEVYQANVELDARVVTRTSELADALERLKVADRQKREFFANVSHELRTPLTLILAPVEQQLSQPQPAPMRELLLALRRNARRLLRLIEDLLDLSRIDAGHLRLDVAPVDLTALARQVVGVFDAAAAGRNVTLEARASEVSETFGDLHRLESVVTNLVGNAVKFTPNGGKVTVTVSQDEREARVAVTDTGPGIPPDAQAQLFTRFYQVPDAQVARRGGVGIGLALSKNLAELHGGRIELDSQVGQGSTFTLVLPRGREHFREDVVERRRVRLEVREARRAGDAPAPAEPPQPRDSPVVASAVGPAMVNGRRARVLVVEDNAELRGLLASLLAPTMDVTEAADGAEGLEAARREYPDVVLSDVMMPRLTGPQLCAALKADPQLRSTPVILLTAKGGDEAALEGFAAGADEFLEKPFHPRVLLARVHAQVRLRALALQLAAQERLVAVGTLAAGVGHEVRNPVNAVLNGVRVLLDRVQEPAHQRLLQVIADGAQRIERISGALVRHASPAESGARPVDLREGLEATLLLLGHRLEGVEVHREFATDATVVAPAGEVNQVFVNLIDNALKAGAKQLWVAVAGDGAAVRVTVADDGRGIPADVATRVFDPFFTTREPGEGTGLGLYLSRRTIEGLGGTLSFSPRPEGGTVFQITLPRELP